MNKLFSALSLAAALSFAIAGGVGACSGESPGTTGHVLAGSSGDSTSGGTSSGGAGGYDGGVEGGVSLESFSYQNQGSTIASSKVSAAFAVQEPQAPSPCTVTEVEACAVEHCDFMPIDAGDDAPFDSGSPDLVLSAGAITVTGGAKTVTLTWDAAKHVYPPFADSQAPLWNGGETLTIAATGSSVPVWKDTVVAPAEITVIAPAIADPAMPLLVDRGADLAVAWQGGAAGSVIFSIVAAAGTSVDSLRCTFDASAGAGNVRALALGLLPAGPATYSVEPFVTKAVAAVPGVSLRASTAGRLPSNELFYGPATLK